MKTINAVLISAVSVIMTLVITLGVTGVATKNQAASQIDLALVNKVAEREATYRQLLDEANQRIQSLNAQLQGISPANTNQPLLTADKALAIANQSVGRNESLSGVPQLVSFQGTTAFEIPFIDGMMYVDATSGAILSSSVKTQINDQKAIDIAANYLGITNSATTTTHVVAPGETISSIAFLYGKNMNAVLAANPGIDPYTLRVGSLVVIPMGNAFDVSHLSVGGSQVYKVTFANYVFFIDKFGAITSVQIVPFAPAATNNSTASVSSNLTFKEN
jgi:LysM repeat protein